MTHYSFSFSQTENFIAEIEQYERLLMRRDNIEWHCMLDRERGNEAMRSLREEHLRKTNEELAEIETRVNEILEDVQAVLAKNPTDRRAELVMMYYNRRQQQPADLEKYTNKVRATRTKLQKEAAATPETLSLF